VAFGRLPDAGEDPICGPTPDRESWLAYVRDFLRPGNCMAGFLKGKGSA